MTPAQLRALATRLLDRPAAPSLDGYELADGLLAAADLLEGLPGPSVHPDLREGSDALRPRVPLRTLLPEGNASETGSKADE